MTATRAATAAARRSRSRAPLPLAYAWAAAIGAGAIMPFAFQPFGWWPLVVPAVGLAIVALRGRSLGAAFGLGFTTGAIFFLLHIQWITVYLGLVPLVALTAWMAAWWGLGGIALALAWRWGEPRMQGPLGAFAAMPLVLGAVWTARESLSSSVPWGGFAWGRLAHSQAASPLADTTSWVGFSGLTFLIAAASALLVQLVLHHRTILRRRLTIAAAALILLVAIPGFPVEATGSIRVGAVQGDSEAGLLAPRVPGQILEQHLDATRGLEGEQLDLLVWPENAAEWYADETPATMAALDRVTERFDAPLVTGTITRDGDDTYNALIQVEPGRGAVAEYRKRHPVPFAEYLPARGFFEPILEALGFLQYIPRDYSIDPSSPNAFDVAGTTAGLAICFDIIDDHLAREMVLEHGAEIILAPTNNADFGEGSAENVQQLAIAQLRAVEAGRALVNISTVGTSAMIGPDGAEIDRLRQYEPGTMLEELPLSTTVTPGIRLGAWIDLALIIGAGLALVGLGVANRTAARRPHA
ncbi:apolipoprotein N-acyltransferase [Agrococcus sp. Marseille-Q4369]|uniref:apolipoprotein N-acyltransferase n=1 Tax=Agrococcus sp. Marseille-Q4369 TaxID=2810513 RepID=UPI001B8B44EA|nr:apolipoprotein N-acyltransferase [Agrococcus sp. Marseille-Q4369]QUW19281.1 apolipoprotein N-acyltransferase [Agrococcus sp. Marseille-Q4369]